jgi:tRNA (guanine-N7-)-methyltransferase
MKDISRLEAWGLGLGADGKDRETETGTESGTQRTNSGTSDFRPPTSGFPVIPHSAFRIPHSTSDLELSLDKLQAIPDVRERWARIFGDDRPLRIEIGVGNSSFLIQVALRDPGFNYLGFEYSPKRVRKVLKKVEASGARCIRILRLNAVRVLAELVAPGSVDRFFVNFPDPWPKRKHAKHRLIQPLTVGLLSRLLRPGGGISLRTDAPAYAAQMVAVLEGVPELVNLAGAGQFAGVPRDEIHTPYELKYRAEGRAIHYLEYRKRSDAGDRPGSP